jgi:GrpB-like predicted nucleotidyltransferase (UPF0157 family)
MQILPLLFFAPVLLLPAIIAVWTGRRSVSLIVLLNIVAVPAAPMIVGLLFSIPVPDLWAARGILAIASGIAVWLALLSAALRKDAPTADDLDEHVKIVDYDTAWPAAFDAERRRLADTLSIPADSIQHIGSTAVPGLAAKPVVDMMLGVDDLDRTREALSRLQILGYENMGEAGVPERLYLCARNLRDPRTSGERDFNLHIVLRGGEHWIRNLALRDLLRRDPDARQRYADAKIQAVNAGATKLLAYSAAKQAVLSDLLARVH